MTILDAAANYVNHHAMLIKAVDLDPEALIVEMHETAALYGETLACGEVGRKLRAEAHIAEQGADEEFGDAQRAIARLLGQVAANLNGRIRYGHEPDPVR